MPPLSGCRLQVGPQPHLAEDQEPGFRAVCRHSSDVEWRRLYSASQKDAARSTRPTPSRAACREQRPARRR